MQNIVLFADYLMPSLCVGESAVPTYNVYTASVLPTLVASVQA